MAALQPESGGGTSNAFVAEFNPFGTGLIYSTYFGGNTADYGQAIALDLAGNAYVAGYTGSPDLPIVAAAQASLAGGYDAFVLVLNSTGSGLDFATYYGGSGGDAANGIALDPSGNVYVAGQTSSANFPVVGARQAVLLGSFDAFILKLQPFTAPIDFSLKSSSAPSVAVGASVPYTLTTTAVNGFIGTVHLAVSGLPAGVSGSLNPASITGSGSSTLTVNASASAAAGNYTVTVNGTSGTLHHNATASLSVTNMSAALSIVKTHSGNFTQGQQNATYTVTVSNAAAAAPSSGAVTVTETIPSGLTVAMAGSGWSCASNTCSRSDVLGTGASYPPITVTVNVAGNATSPQVNRVSVSGGGSVTGNTTDSTAIDAFASQTRPHLGVFESGIWFVDMDGNGLLTGSEIFGWGAASDTPVLGDWNGSGIDKAGVFRNGLWFLDFSGNHQLTSSSIIGWGQSGDLPVVGDWNNSGTSKIGVFRNGVWFLDLTGNHQLTSSNQIIGWGPAGGVPVVGDWNGDRTTKIGVFQNGVWYLDTDGSHQLTSAKIIGWGKAGDIPVVGDWNGDGKTKIGVFRNGTWFLDITGNHQLVQSDIVGWGQPSDTPVVGDWNKTGTSKIGVFSSGTWFVDLTGNHQLTAAGILSWGKAGDKPVPGRW